MTDIPKSCPCSSNRSYKSCCQPLHDKKLTANSAEQLMCSRYSAFCLGKIDYLIATLLPEKRQDDDEQILHQTIKDTHWLGLKIIQHSQQEQTASVEFIAFYQDNPVSQLHERSRFIHQGGL